MQSMRVRSLIGKNGLLQIQLPEKMKHLSDIHSQNKQKESHFDDLSTRY